VVEFCTLPTDAKLYDFVCALYMRRVSRFLCQNCR